MKKIAYIIAVFGSLASTSVLAAKLECKTSTDKYQPYFRGFQVETNAGRVVSAKFQDTYGHWEKADEANSLMTATINPDSSIHIQIKQMPGHDEHIANFDLKTGKSKFQEYSFVDCLGAYDIQFPISCQEVQEFSKK